MSEFWGHTHEITVPKNAKLADITEADTTKHTLDLAAALSETRTIVSIIVGSTRIAGTGNLQCYSNEGTDYVSLQTFLEGEVISLAAGTNRLQYSLSVKNDDFDVYCFGYVVKG